MINGTLLIQIINFYIAYTILKRIALKPALVIINKQNEYVQKMQHELVDIKHKIAVYEEHSKKIWQECSLKLASYVPHSQKAVRFEDTDEIARMTYLETPVFVEDETVIIQALTQKLVHVITSDISHEDKL